MKDVDQDMFAEGFRIAKERKSEGVEVDMEPKTLKSGCSTTLVAALDPSLKGTNHSISPGTPQTQIQIPASGFVRIETINADIHQIHLAPCFATAPCTSLSRTTPRIKTMQHDYGL